MCSCCAGHLSSASTQQCDRDVIRRGGFRRTDSKGAPASKRGKMAVVMREHRKRLWHGTINDVTLES
jgi:hypothetical protein